MATLSMNNKLLPVLQKLSDEMKAMNRLLNQTLSDSTFAAKSGQITEQLATLKNQSQAELNAIDFAAILSEIKHLTSSIIQEKAKNPLIPDELVAMASNMDNQVEQAEELLQKERSDSDQADKQVSWLMRLIEQIKNFLTGK